MKRLLKYFLAALVVITGVFAQTADAKAFSYTYTVSFSAGGQGSINGGVQVRKASGNGASVSVSAKEDKIIVTGLEYGDVISCDAQGSVALNENSKYYVKGIRLSGRDNSTVAQSAFLVSGDQDYVVHTAYRASLLSIQSTMWIQMAISLLKAVPIMVMWAMSRL